MTLFLLSHLRDPRKPCQVFFFNTPPVFLQTSLAFLSGIYLKHRSWIRLIICACGMLKSLSTFFILGCFFVLVTGSHNVVQVNLVYSALLKLVEIFYLRKPPKCWDWVWISLVTFPFETWSLLAWYLSCMIGQHALGLASQQWDCKHVSDLPPALSKCCVGPRDRTWVLRHFVDWAITQTLNKYYNSIYYL